MKCIIEDCYSDAKDRKYFFIDEPMCDLHYAGYLEWLLDSLNIEVSAEMAESSFEKYKIELKPLRPSPAKPKPKQPVSGFKMKM